MVAVLGPLCSVHAIVLMIAPPLPDAVPVRVTLLVGRLIVWAVPAPTVGGWAGLTVTITVAELDRLLLSVAVNLKV